ncbi:MAG: peptide chain release factor N(5)-glutamine methyltransferase [Eubacterium sp.]|nr:peptide chain release factor N(5)-glutamine methyltransferase [Eubacterium sp.]
MEKTVRILYKEGQDRLAEAGIHDAVFDARALMSFAVDIPFRDIPLHYQDAVSDDQALRYDDLIGRRIRKEPLQYITGEQEFMGLSFHVDSRVLIPRLDTEILCEEALEYINGRIEAESEYVSGRPERHLRVLDLCCGSGALGLSIAALSDKETDVVLSDISRDALDVAAENAERLGVSDKVTFVKSDLFEDIQGDFDLIVCNPPYIRSDVILTLDEEVRGHEPVLALDGGSDGLDVYRRIAEETPGYLKPQGRLMMETGFDQGEDLKGLLEAHFKDVRIKKDLAGLDRVISAVRRTEQ